MVSSQLSILVLAASMALVMSAPSAQPGGLLDGLFKDAPLLGREYRIFQKSDLEWKLESLTKDKS